MKNTYIKKILFIILFNILFSFYLNAETRGNLDKGTFFYGNSLTMEMAQNKTEISTEGSQNSKSDFFNMDGKLGYFLFDNFELGFELSFKSAEYDFDDNTTEKASSYFYGIQAYYFIDLHTSFYPYIGCSYGHYREEIENRDATSIEAAGEEIQGKAGINFFISEMIALDVGFNYVHIETNEDEESDVNSEFNSYNTKIGINLFLK